ncbi:DNA-processing protein DprA [Duganella qianjiadongensis]|uniref:DNA-processing protein DprA n=1 Tax=Duganella qianjiadongensis TaxID=2692176 RepID=UPI003530E717
MPATECESSQLQPVSAQALAGCLRLQQVDGVGLQTAHRLLRRFGSYAALFEASYEALLDCLRPAQASALLAAPAPALAGLVEATLRWQAQPGHALLLFGAPGYPPLLAQLPAPPLLLYVQGRRELLAQTALAIVGSRNASGQGRLTAQRMAHTLSDAGLTIISGLALGIDAAAHVGGLAGQGSTVACIGTGPDRIYPACHGELARRIAVEGCMVSEFALGTPPLRDNFPRRNRLISGLAAGVLVVEAAAKSGSLITARLAADQGREVYAIPGSIHATLARGCHQLIREDGAKLVESADDILVDLGRLQRAAAGYGPPDDGFVDTVLAALGQHSATADGLASQLGQSVAELQGQLLALELAGLIERLPGGQFQRVWQ